MKKKDTPKRKRRQPTHITVTCDGVSAGLPCNQEITIRQNQLGVVCPKCGTWVTAKTKAYREALKRL